MATKGINISVIIPSYKDTHLNDTILSILDNFETNLEVIPVLDGYMQDVIDDVRVKPIYLKKNGGMRNAINTGVLRAEGKYIMRTDEHCMFDAGFDRKMTELINDNEIMDATRYFLDPEKWEVMDLPPINFEKLIIDEKYPKFTAVRWKSKDAELENVQLAPKGALQGSVWVMSHSWWDKTIVELDSNGYGPLYQDTTEMLMKTWKAGGRLMLNKTTWYAHKHRSFNRTHHYPTERAQGEWKFALDTWRDYYESIIKPTWQT